MGLEEVATGSAAAAATGWEEEAVATGVAAAAARGWAEEAATAWAAAVEVRAAPAGRAAAATSTTRSHT